MFAIQLCKAAGANAVGVVSSPEKGELVKRLGAVDFIDRNDFAGMMRKGGETPDEEKARFKECRGFAKKVKEILGDAPDIVFEHVGRQPSLLRFSGEAVRQGRDLRRHVRATRSTSTSATCG